MTRPRTLLILTALLMLSIIATGQYYGDEDPGRGRRPRRRRGEEEYYEDGGYERNDRRGPYAGRVNEQERRNQREEMNKIRSRNREEMTS